MIFKIKSLVAISSTVLNCIVNKINKAQFFSLIVDTTQDISKKDQMSFIVRYTPVSYTHLDVYKRQGVGTRFIPMDREFHITQVSTYW